MGTSFQRVSYSFMEKGMEIAVNTAAAANNSQLTAVIDSMGMLAEASNSIPAPIAAPKIITIKIIRPRSTPNRSTAGSVRSKEIAPTHRLTNSVDISVTRPENTL